MQMPSMTQMPQHEHWNLQKSIAARLSPLMSMFSSALAAIGDSDMTRPSSAQSPESESSQVS